MQNSRSQRVLWLLEELNVPYTIKKYQRDPKTMLAPPELKKVHPLGKSPVVEVDGRVLAETGLITEVLVDKFGKDKLAPPASDTGAYLKYKYWLHFAEGMPRHFCLLLFLSSPGLWTVVMPLSGHLVGIKTEYRRGLRLRRDMGFIMCGLTCTSLVISIISLQAVPCHRW